MPLKSRKQVRKFGAMMREGKITPTTFDEWLKATPNIKGLPERVKTKKKGKS